MNRKISKKNSHHQKMLRCRGLQKHYELQQQVDNDPQSSDEVIGRNLASLEHHYYCYQSSSQFLLFLTYFGFKNSFVRYSNDIRKSKHLSFCLNQLRTCSWLQRNNEAKKSADIIITTSQKFYLLQKSSLANILQSQICSFNRNKYKCMKEQTLAQATLQTTGTSVYRQAKILKPLCYMMQKKRTCLQPWAGLYFMNN